MELIKRYQIRGVSGEVSRVQMQGRIVDYWIPKTTTGHLLIAHDGQNVFDGKTSTHRRSTWEMAQSASRVSEHLGITPPAIIAPALNALMTLTGLLAFIVFILTIFSCDAEITL